MVSPRRPTAALLIYLHPVRGVISDTRSLHSISILHIHILPACVHHGFRIFRDRRYGHRIFSEHDYPLLYYTRVLDVREYIQTYSLACPWLLSWPDFLRGEERYDDSPGTHVKVIAASRR